MGDGVKLIDSGAECVRDISVLLNYFEINRERTIAMKSHQFYKTASSQAFDDIAENWLQMPIKSRT